MSRLAEIEARVNAATTGQWGVVRWMYSTSPRGDNDTAIYSGEFNRADSEFLSHARADVTALLSMVRARNRLLAALTVSQEDPIEKLRGPE